MGELKNIKEKKFEYGQKRGKYFDIEEILAADELDINVKLIPNLEKLDLIYRTLCGIMFNFVPKSGHPGGSVSSGRFVQSLLYKTMSYDISDPNRQDADMISYAAGHKALGLYTAWALRNELVRISKTKLLPDEKKQLRLEDLLGFRRNPTSTTPLFNKYKVKPLDGHPTPATPFIKLATGASGVGITASLGLALGALDTYGAGAPVCHVIEGEGGLTPGRVAEALATAASAQIKNIVLHIDWNQASIDSNNVCSEAGTPGDYVQWNPLELAAVNDWNVIYVKNGFNFRDILAAQYLALNEIKNNQPTAIVYRTVKGWKYGIEGRASHGAGHEFCSEGFYEMIAPFESEFGETFPKFTGDKGDDNIEKVFYDYLMVIRKVLENNKDLTDFLASQIENSKKHLNDKKLKPRDNAPDISLIYKDSSLVPDKTPKELQLEPGKSVTHRGVLGDTLAFLNKKSKGAIIGSSADLFGSTSISNLAKGLSEGYFNFEKNPKARLIMTGGICEDAMGGVMAGLSSFGNHIGAGSSYGAFIAALQHVPARLHAIGQEARVHAFGGEQNPFFIICAHAGPKTGEDGPTHADPQALQLMQENFPKGKVITLTAWDTQEIWPLMIAALKKRPAVIVPFVTRPNEKVVDRSKFGLPPASAAANGVYAIRKADPKAKQYNGTIVLQGNGAGDSFVTEVMPELDKLGFNFNAYYVASSELFEMLPASEQEKIFPEAHAKEAMGVSEFTLPTMYRWVLSREGRRRTLYPFKNGHFLGSGQSEKVFREAGLDAQSQLKAISDYARFIEKL